MKKTSKKETRILKTGDIVQFNLSPTNGHEQSGYRPALVVSVASFHKTTQLIWVVPITSAMDDFPTHVSLTTKNGVVKGNVLCEHLRSIDPQARQVKLVDEATSQVMKQCKTIIDSITFIGV